VKRVGAIAHPCKDGERLCFNPIDEDCCRHLVVEKSQDYAEIGRATTSGQHFPESFATGGVEDLSQVNESHVETLVLFPTFLLGFYGPQRSCPWFLELT